MAVDSLEKLYVDQLRDIYDAENQLVRALPKMAKAASSTELRSAFEDHLEKTRGHVRRLDEIFQTLGHPPKGKSCKAMIGLIEGLEKWCARKGIKRVAELTGAMLDHPPRDTYEAGMVGIS